MYNEEAVKDLKFIEHCKKLHIPLDEIKAKLELKKARDVNDRDVEHHISSVSEQMKHLHNEINELIPLLQKMELKRKEAISEQLSPESVSLIRTLLLITSS